MDEKNKIQESKSGHLTGLITQTELDQDRANIDIRSLETEKKKMSKT
jgi:hypothetical protein